MEQYQEIQNAVLDQLQKDEATAVFNLWFKDLVLESIEGNVVTLSINSEFKQRILTEHHLEKLANRFEAVLGFPVKVKISLRYENPEEIKRRASEEEDRRIEEEDERRQEEKERRRKEEEKRRSEEIARNIESSDVVSGYTFENFIVGDSNRFAHAACFAVAMSFTTDEEYLTNPVEEKYNPLFIYGPSGLGKTHLLYAITNEIKVRSPGTKFIYIRCEDFVNELIEAIRHSTTQDFRTKYRSTDVLMIDDIQFIAGKEAVQEEFFNTFNTLFDSQKQIILTSDRPPCDIPNLADRLRTRFEWGLTADIQPPTPELRAAIIKTKADKQGIQLNGEIIRYMADHIKSNIRTIEGAIRRLHAMNTLTGTVISLESAKRALADVESGAGENSYILDRIFKAVTKHFHIPADVIKGRGRQGNVVYARHVCMYLIRRMTDYPLSDIGSFFSCQHSNVILACNKIENMMETDMRCREEVENLIDEIKED
ncbi:MAG: chromosomal replication initiator protein DnaA [Eubacteriales bacterium]|nr:chromosomal replication initiator protein DnaA [Eubacteriales bacterium]